MHIPSEPSRNSLLSALSAGILAASTAAVFIRLAQAEGAPSIVIAAARLSISALLLAPITLTRHRPALRVVSFKEWLLGLLSGIFLAFHFATWVTSLEYTTVASSVVLVTTTPLWVALLSPLLLHERMHKGAIIGLMLALAGGMIIGLADACTWQAGFHSCPSMQVFFSGKAFLGDLLALLGAWFAAGYMLIGRKLRAQISLVPYIFIVYGMAALVLLGIMFGTGANPLGLPPQAYLWFVMLALLPQLFGHSIFNWALRYLPASYVSLTQLGEPIGSTILAFFIFQEEPGWFKMVGAFLILAGIWLSTRTTSSR